MCVVGGGVGGGGGLGRGSVSEWLSECVEGSEEGGKLKCYSQ